MFYKARRPRLGGSLGKLTLPTGPLDGDTQPKLLMGAGEIATPQVTKGGGFTGYQPVATLPLHSSFIIQFTEN